MKKLRLPTAVRQVHSLDWLLLALTFLLASFTLFYPFGRDQGLYHYVGREWFRGALPYRDVMDQKTPIIYLVFGSANLIFGEHLWSIRLVELLWVMGIGWALGTAAAPRGSAAEAGVRGAGAFVTCILYFGPFGYWDTAQSEIWYAGFCFLSLMIVQRFERPRAGPLWAGVWTGMSCLAKPPAVFLGLGIVLLLVMRMASQREAHESKPVVARLRTTVRALVWFGLGAALPLLLTVGYFAVRGGALDMYDVVVRCNAYYREHEMPAADFAKRVESTGYAWRMVYPLSLFSLLASCVGLVWAYRRRSLAVASRYLVALSLPLGAIASVWLQGLLFPYHWGALHVCWAVGLVFAIQDLARGLPRKLIEPIHGAWISAALCLLVFIGYTAIGPSAPAQWDNTKRMIAYLRGELPKADFDAHSNIPGFYDWTANLAIGDWLREHSKPDDRVATRNFEPAIYAVAQRSSGLRFFWTAWIAWDHRAYRRADWAARDLAQVAAHPPRFVVVNPNLSAGPDSIQYFWPFGTWVERMRAGGMAVFERVAERPTAP